METLKCITRTILVILFIFGTTSSSIRQSYCQQQFRFLFRDKAKDIFWIGENLYGDDCEHSRAIKIETSNGIHISEKVLEDFDHWEETEPDKNDALLDYAIELENTNKSWEYSLVQLKVKKPTYNAKLMNFYLEELNSVCGKGWNNAMGLNGRLLPKITSTKTPHLIYFHPDGLYFNYEISKAYYFPDSQYLLVFTRQPTQCIGGGSMHGFFVFKFH